MVGLRNHYGVALSLQFLIIKRASKNGLGITRETMNPGKHNRTSDVLWILFVVSVLAFSGYRAHLQAQEFESNRVVQVNPPTSNLVRAGIAP